ncbi:MAG: alanine racemase, partial [Bacteriovoracaceae bacterium]
IGLFLQHNTSGEQEKAGFRSFSELLEAALVLQEAQDKEGPKRFYLQGLMTMGSIRTENFEESARECFEQLRSLRDEIEAQTKHSKLELSMGMSQDYEIAIEKGADWVRIGSNIFGSR